MSDAMGSNSTQLRAMGTRALTVAVLLGAGLLVATAFGLATSPTGGASHRTGASASAEPWALTVPTPTTNASAAIPGTIDLGMQLNVSVNVSSISGGSGNASNYTFAWSGLPTNCTSQNVSNYTCTPTATGTFQVAVTVHDLGSDLTGTSTTVPITVNPDPAVSSLVVSASSVVVGGTITFTTSGSGGTGPLSYVYGGLPSGCAGNTSTITCSPTVAQTYNVTVYVLDAVGMASGTQTVTVDVTATTSSSSPSPTALDWAVIAIILIVGFLGVALLLARARREERNMAAAPQRNRPRNPPTGSPPAGGPPPGGGSPPSG